VAETLGVAELYRRTGIQLMPINTLFQLAAHDRAELARACRLVMLPELVAYDLTGQVAGELSNAGTTGLLDVATGAWATDLAASIGIDPQILPTPERAGRLLGEYDGTPVHLVAAHDTACAFAASPLAATGRAFISAGTWFLVGVERALPDISEEARLANFSNERGALGGFRFLKNVPGFWLLEQCAAQWGTNAVDLLGAAAGAPSNAPRFDVTDDRLLAPARMADVVRAAAGLRDDAPRALIARSVVESIAAAVADVVGQLRANQPVEELVVVGGGAASSFVRERIAERAAAGVVAGATEATALGNALVQGIALKRFRNLDDARSWASASSAAR
jgi:rhamnulokinase